MTGGGSNLGPDSTESRSHQTHPWHPDYDGPPILAHRHRGRSRRSCLCTYLFWWWFVISTVVVLGSLWILLCLYGPKHLEIGLNYSRLLKANRWLVEGITVQNNDPTQGPLLYHFKDEPPLDGKRKWVVLQDVIVPGFYHEEWAFWLNQGSEVKVKYNVLSDSSLFSIVAKGKNNFKKCMQDPGNPDWCLLWSPVDGDGKIKFEVMKDDNYYLGIANLYQTNLEIVMSMKIKAKVYGTEQADFFCPLDIKPCTIDLSLRGSEVGLLTTPDMPQKGVDVWHVTVLYNPRWVTYLLIYGELALLLLAICSCRSRSKKLNVFHPEIAPLNSQTGAANYCAAETVGETLWPNNEPNFNFSSGAGRVTEEVPDENLCTICFEGYKNSFFHPCGHYTTCYNCGLRVKEMSGKCPICRQSIQDVRKIFIT